MKPDLPLLLHLAEAGELKYRRPTLKAWSRQTSSTSRAPKSRSQISLKLIKAPQPPQTASARHLSKPNKLQFPTEARRLVKKARMTQYEKAGSPPLGPNAETPKINIAEFLMKLQNNKDPVCDDPRIQVTKLMLPTPRMPVKRRTVSCLRLRRVKIVLPSHALVPHTGEPYSIQ